MKHYTQLPAAIDMAPYAPWYQAITRKVAENNRSGLSSTLIVEAGVRHGCSARIFMDTMRDFSDWHIHLIDPVPRPEALECAEQNERVTFHADTAQAVATQFEDDSIDLLHIDVDNDATHPYDLTKSVFDAFLPKLKQTAIVIFHDCTSAFPGVQQVVRELSDSGEYLAIFCDPDPLCPIAAPAYVKRIRA